MSIAMETHRSAQERRTNGVRIQSAHKKKKIYAHTLKVLQGLSCSLALILSDNGGHIVRT